MSIAGASATADEAPGAPTVLWGWESIESPCAAFYYSYFGLRVFFFVGFLGAGFFVVGAGPRRGMSLAVMGEPKPVQASQPGVAEKAPLLPWVMSLKAEAALAA